MSGHKAVIIEDNAEISRFLEAELQRDGRFESITTIDDGTEGLDVLMRSKVDLVLMDVELPGMSGFDILKNLVNPPYVILVTGYDSYAKEAFDYGTIDYVSKPVNPDRLAISLDRAHALIAKSMTGDKQIVLDTLGTTFKGVKRNIFVTFSNIVYISSNAKHSVLHTINDQIEVIGTLKDVESKLPISRFRRVHKQFVINMEYLSHIEYFSGGSHVAYLKDDEKSQIPVSRIYLHEI
ncbi:hypothetical protein CH373_11285 [Leptospira perolatii]|uniref:DNA-binding response regulator n=1 Tax=Leptospira perolatii TaxID=2023191 RepID=A0A2M9ZM39_9LEPT|nr:LytTR family DNA-binding domain-containing protein [Leptospira perolatii]PJZ69714.1 hypothetical protein CH360_08950 [Leptospira perolatii]PJZ73071.1 hypothetical protein CH373_11285 [Leptospira perolatii]